MRNKAIDTTKGILVIFMVFYHAVNYFIESTSILKYFRFILPAFIFLSGFVISSILQKKYSGQFGLLTFKLIKKGFKLILLFTILNIVILSVFETDAYGRKIGITKFSDIFSIFINGNENSTAFPILMMIGVLYVLAPFFIKFNHHFNKMILFLSLSLILFVTLSVHLNLANFQIICLTYGLIGMYFGQFSEQKINQLNKYKILIILLLIFYQIILFLFQPPFIIKVFGITVIILFFYQSDSWISSISYLRNVIYLCGRFSLIAYILHIGILFALKRLFTSNIGEIGHFTLAVLVTLPALVLSIQLLSYLINRSKLFNKIYKIIFV